VTGNQSHGGGFHPGAKVLAVALVGGAAILARGPAGLAATGILALSAGARVPGALAAFAALAGRLRWVFLFIVLLHGWFTPGRPVAAGGGPWWPTLEGLARGGELVGVVLLMSGLVAVLVRSTPAPELAAGVAWLLAPLARLGVPAERFGRLLAWTLDRVEPVRREARSVREALRLRRSPGGGVMGRIRLEADAARVVLRRAREAADRNAEALFLRRAGQVRRLGRPAPTDLLLLGGAGAWAGALGWIAAGPGW